MEKMLIEYSGNLKTRATHLRSGKVIITDAPIDNQGEGSEFSPTDMAAAALASCILTVMGIIARNSGFSIDGSRVKLIKTMGVNPRRISEIDLDFDFGQRTFSDKEIMMLQHAVKNCPVAQSLHPDIKINVHLNL